MRQIFVVVMVVLLRGVHHMCLVQLQQLQNINVVYVKTDIVLDYVCIDNACFDYFNGSFPYPPSDIRINGGNQIDCVYSCTGNNQLEYVSGQCDFL